MSDSFLNGVEQKKLDITVQIMINIIIFIHFLYLANKDKMEAKQEIEILENKYSLDLATYKSNLEKCAKEYEDLKTEVNFTFFTILLY